MSETWIKKLNGKKDLPKIIQPDEKTAKRLKAHIMVVPSPKDVYDIMANVPEGRLITVAEIRKKLAEKYRVDTACPLTTGIFIWIAANASEEMKENGMIKESIPWWRTLKSKGELVTKYPGGLERHKTLLEKEGHKVFRKGKRMFVAEFERKLI
jgi:alkylated DNA nucleotide flippase Atl1